MNADGSQVRLGDVARVALNSESYTRDTKYNGKPAAGVAIRLAAGQNALDTVNGIHETLDRLAPFFPRGFEVVYPLDTTPFVRTSIEEVVKTLIEAVVLVFLVMYLFLQNVRATLIPTIAVPVVLLGTFGVLAAFGFSINTLTMFGMALAIGLLVDDAIVVVENVERVMAEEGLSPREATRKSMDQITGALVGIALVLARGVRADGVLRRLDRRDLPPVLDHAGVGDGAVGAGGAGPDAGAVRHDPQAAAAFRARGAQRLLRLVQPQLRRAAAASTSAASPPCCGGPAARCWCTARSSLVMGLLFTRIPTSFLPNEDQGFMYGQVQTPPGASKERTWAVLDQAQKYLTRAGEGRGRGRAHRRRLQLRRHRARTRACCSSSCRTGTSATRTRAVGQAHCSGAPTSTSHASRTP